MRRSLDEQKKHLATLEASFSQLSQLTGVASYDQMVEKFSLMQVNRSALEKDKVGAEERLLAAKRRAVTLEKRFQELRAEGVGVAEVTREKMDKLEDALLAARSECKMLTTTSERLAAVLIGLQQAGITLTQRVEAYRSILDEDVFKLTQADEGLPWSQTLDLLNLAEQILVKMVESMSMSENSPAKIRMGSIELEDGFSETSGSTISEGSHFDDLFGSKNANNVRIYSRKEALRNELELVNPPSNTQYLKYVFVILGVELIATKDVVHEDLKANTVPSRQEVKRRSALTASSASKRIELEERNKLLSNRVQEGHADSGEARVRAQQLYADRYDQHEVRCNSLFMAPRLAHTTTNSYMLPEGATLKDDIMRKTECFLAAKPADNILA